MNIVRYWAKHTHVLCAHNYKHDGCVKLQGHMWHLRYDVQNLCVCGKCVTKVQ
jgi:hypothetical protein